jgi:hypothetical protein
VFSLLNTRTGVPAANAVTPSSRNKFKVNLFFFFFSFYLSTISAKLTDQLKVI